MKTELIRGTVFRTLFVLSIIFQGCRYFSGELEVVTVLPELPSEWESFKSEIEFRIIYPDREGGLNSLGGINPGEMTGITILKSANFPVIAQPCLKTVSPHTGGMRPAGGIYPHALGGDNEFHLSWEEGFLADCMMEVGMKSSWAEGVNTRKLREIIESEALEAWVSGDPWFLDRRKLIRPILFGRFYGGFAAAAPVYPVILPAGRTEWVSGDPLFDISDYLDPDSTDGHVPDDPVTESGELTILLPEGYHRFIAPDGGSVLDIMVDESGWDFLLE